MKPEKGQLTDKRYGKTLVYVIWSWVSKDIIHVWGI